VGVFLLLAIVVIGYLFFDRISKLDTQMQVLGEQAEEVKERVEEMTERVERVSERAESAQSLAQQAARDARVAQAQRLEAEASMAISEEKARLAEEEAARAREQVIAAHDEVQRIRREREEELNRLQNALNQIAETQRTALGLVMNLGSDQIRFDFDKAELRPEYREILSRIAGVLLTSDGYRVQIYGHTDDIGTAEYNQKLSELRADAVKEYLVEAGIDPAIISTKGFGKSNPLVPGVSPQARAKNRRVEVGIIDTIISYDRPVENGGARR
jgi:outer membrane protein OmpA-like peptidoglycan-associated protein